MKELLNYVDFDLACKKSIELVTVVNNNEIIHILESIGRVVSKDILCEKNLPSFNNSAMDGFAFKFTQSDKTLKVIDTIFAGDKKVFPDLKDDECYRIMTGAKVPANADTIIPIELDNPIIYDKDHNIINYDEMVKQVTQLNQRYTESARKL